MKTENFYQKDTDRRQTGVLDNQRVTVSLNETEIWSAIDCCNFMQNNKEKMGCREESKIRKIISKLVEANENLWESKEIKTRKNSLLSNYGQLLSSPKPNPILMDGEF